PPCWQSWWTHALSPAAVPGHLDPDGRWCRMRPRPSRAPMAPFFRGTLGEGHWEMAEPAARAEIPAGTLMQGKRGLIMGVANNRSIAWGIAKAVAAQGAALAFTYQGEALKKRVEPLAAEADSEIVLPCDVADSGSMDAVFAELSRRWGEFDFLVHAIAFSDKAELDGRYIDTSAKNFSQTMLIS